MKNSARKKANNIVDHLNRTIDRMSKQIEKEHPEFSLLTSKQREEITKEYISKINFKEIFYGKRRQVLQTRVQKQTRPLRRHR